jgi:hypothetical protein
MAFYIHMYVNMSDYLDSPRPNLVHSVNSLLPRYLLVKLPLNPQAPTIPIDVESISLC